MRDDWVKLAVRLTALTIINSVYGAPFPLIPLILIIPSFLVGNSPILGASLVQRPRGWVLNHPPSQYSTQVSGQYSLKVPAYKFFAYF